MWDLLGLRAYANFLTKFDILTAMIMTGNPMSWTGISKGLSWARTAVGEFRPGASKTPSSSSAWTASTPATVADGTSCFMTATDGQRFHSTTRGDGRLKNVSTYYYYCYCYKSHVTQVRRPRNWTERLRRLRRPRDDCAVTSESRRWAAAAFWLKTKVPLLL